MKRKLFYGTCLCVAVISSTFYACKKEAGEQPEALIQAGGHVPGSRFEGEKLYYSKNQGDTVYKMILKGDGSGNVSVNRSVYATTRPDTFQTKSYLAGDISYSKHYIGGDSMKLDSVSIHRTSKDNVYFFIPFQPGSDTVCLTPNYSGDLVYDCIPMAACPVSTVCYLIPNIFGDTAFFCWGCDHCWVVVKLPMGFPGNRITSPSGSVLIEANSLQIEN